MASEVSVPRSWTASPVSHFFEVKYGKANPRRDGQVPVVGSSGIYASTDVPLVHGPTIVVGRKGSAGQVWFVEQPCYPSDTTFYLVSKPGADADPEFVAYALRAAAIGPSDDVIPSLQRGELENTEIVLPDDLMEQREIARTLRTLEAAIKIEAAQSEKLAALKSATMAKLLREGLRGEPLKQTDIGEIPERWNVATCEDVCDPITVGIVVTPAKYYVPAGIPCFRSFNVKPNRLTGDNLVYIAPESNELHSKSKIRAGDVLVVRTGYPGTACVVPPQYDGANCIDLLIARPRTQLINAGFLAAYLNSPEGKAQVTQQQGGLAQQHYNVGALRKLKIPVPSPEDQIAIAEIVKAIEDRLIVSEQKSAALQRLFIASLHSLITGAIRIADLKVAEVPHA